MPSETIAGRISAPGSSSFLKWWIGIPRTQRRDYYAGVRASQSSRGGQKKKKHSPANPATYAG